METKKISIVDKLKKDGYFEDKKEIQSWIMMRKIFANDEPILFIGQKVKENAEIRIKGYDEKYVNKGGLKLEGALDDFGINVSGKIAIDSGASKGGFTDCLVQRGTKKVYAVDVGYGELSGKLRQNPKVINLEKTNISDDKLLNLEEKPNLATLDLSYLSLKKAIPIASKILSEDSIIICLVKPIYEVESSEIRRSGNINNKDEFTKILTILTDYINNELNYNVIGISHSHVTGNKGTIEFFIALSLSNTNKKLSNKEIIKQIESAINNGLKLEKFKK